MTLEGYYALCRRALETAVVRQWKGLGSKVDKGKEGNVGEKDFSSFPAKETSYKQYPNWGKLCT